MTGIVAISTAKWPGQHTLQQMYKYNRPENRNSCSEEGRTPFWTPGHVHTSASVMPCLDHGNQELYTTSQPWHRIKPLRMLIVSKAAESVHV